jgi:uncharacterized membrane protein YdjX (TVP38/TMEM64 family)
MEEYLEEPTPACARSRLAKGWKLLAGVLAVSAFVLIARHLPVVDWLERLTGTIRSLGAWGVAVYALLLACAAMCCVPCMPVTLAGGFILGTVHGVIAVHLGTCLAASFGFLIGRIARRTHIADLLRRSERFHVIDTAIAREGWKIVALLRMHALPFGLSNYIYGMTAVSFWHYFLATALAMLPGNIIFVHLGAVGSRKLGGEGGMHPLEFVLVGLGVVSLIVMGRLVTRMVRTHRTAKVSQHPT